MQATYTITTKTGNVYEFDRASRIPGVVAGSDNENVLRASATLVLLHAVKACAVDLDLADVDKVESWVRARSGKDLGSHVLYVSPELAERERAAAERHYAEYSVNRKSRDFLRALDSTIDGLRGMAERLERERTYLVANGALPDSKYEGHYAAPTLDGEHVGAVARRAVHELTVALPQHIRIEDIVSESMHLGAAQRDLDALTALASKS